MKVAVQINGTPPCPIWARVAAGHETVWLDCSPHQPPTPDPLTTRPDLIVVQCAARWWDLHKLGWGDLTCPIVASCGDASVLCNLDMVFRNLPLLSRLYVEGYDYVEKYLGWCAERDITPDLEKFRFQKLCADNHFPPLPPEPKLYDWCFLGQTYPAYDERLRHHRRELVPVLLDREPSAYVSGPGWAELVGGRSRGDWVDQSLLNAVYNKSRAVVSIDAHDGAGYTSTRTIEAMHGGHCILLYDHPGMWYLKEWVRDGEHVLFFGSPEEFSTKLEWVRRNPGRAAAIGVSARVLVLERGWTASAWMTDCLSHR